MSTLQERIIKVSDQLESLEEEKSQIEDKIDNTLKDITRLSKCISKAERDVQKAAKNKLTRECQERLKCEIYRLKKEQKRAEKLMDVYDKQLCDAYKQYTKCNKELTD